VLHDEADPGGTAATETTQRAVDASNALTARWVRSIGRSSFVASGAAVWVLLGALATGAAGEARAELERAVGIPAGEGLDAAAALFAALQRLEGVGSALGIWIRDHVVLAPAWRAGTPVGEIRRLTGRPDRDRAELDAWARERTRGLLSEMPLPVTEGTLLVLASALVVKTRWATPFTDVPALFRSGPWAGRVAAGLRVRVKEPDRVVIAGTPHGPITMFTVTGADDVDVHLATGASEMAPGVVLAEAIATLEGAHPVRMGTDLAEGETAPCLAVSTILSPSDDPAWVDVRTVRFDLIGEHDLTADPDIFGIRTALDRTRGHFPGVSATPLAIDQATQVARARFGALGFEAGAVNPVGMRIGAPNDRFEVRLIELTFDRPFGFLAVDRSTGLVLFAGWVGDPEPYHPSAQSDPSD
jgi:hypothetical protein